MIDGVVRRCTAAQGRHRSCVGGRRSTQRDADHQSIARNDSEQFAAGWTGTALEEQALEERRPTPLADIHPGPPLSVALLARQRTGSWAAVAREGAGSGEGCVGGPRAKGGPSA